MKKSIWLLLSVTLSTSLLAQQATPTAAAPGTDAKPAAAPSNPAVNSSKAASDNAVSRTVSLVPGPAMVIASNVNVRGQARLRSEVVTRVTKGQQVTVLEEIVRNNSADNEPSAWAKITLPNNKPVWVHSSFISNNVVVPPRLNVRSGPGENYSVLGMLERGAEVKPLETKESWVQIEPPANAYAFVAAQYLRQEPATEIASAPSVQTPEPAAPAAPAVPETPVTPETVPDTPIVAPPPSDAPVLPNTASTETPATNAPAAEQPSEPVVASATDTNTVPEEVIEEPPPKRIVQREGIVRGTVSIQAPSHFALVSGDTGKLINYLYTSSPSLDLRRFKGLRVVVTGEEAIEERWGNTPVITIQRIEPLDE